MKSVAGTLRLDLAQYRELEAFAKFGSDLDKATLAQLTRGERMVEILKQNQYVPMDVAKQIVIIFSAANSYLDDVDADKISDFEKGLFDYLDANNSTELDSITAEGKISEDVEKKLNEAITSFKGGFTA